MAVDGTGSQNLTVVQPGTVHIHDGGDPGRLVLGHICDVEFPHSLLFLSFRIDDCGGLCTKLQRNQYTSGFLDGMGGIQVGLCQQVAILIHKCYAHGTQQFQTLLLIFRGAGVEDVAAAGALCGTGAQSRQIRIVIFPNSVRAGVTDYHGFCLDFALVIQNRLAVFVQNVPGLPDQFTFQSQSAVKGIGAEPEVQGHAVGIRSCLFGSNQAALSCLCFCRSCIINQVIRCNCCRGNVCGYGDTHKGNLQTGNLHFGAQHFVHVYDQTALDHNVLCSAAGHAKNIAGADGLCLRTVNGGGVDVRHDIDRGAHGFPAHGALVVIGGFDWSISTHIGAVAVEFSVTVQVGGHGGQCNVFACQMGLYSAVIQLFNGKCGICLVILVAIHKMVQICGSQQGLARIIKTVDIVLHHQVDGFDILGTILVRILHTVGQVDTRQAGNGVHVVFIVIDTCKFHHCTGQIASDCIFQTKQHCIAGNATERDRRNSTHAVLNSVFRHKERPATVIRNPEIGVCKIGNGIRHTAVITVFHGIQGGLQQGTGIKHRRTQCQRIQAVIFMRKIDQVAPFQVGFQNTAQAVAHRGFVRSQAVKIGQGNFQIAVGGNGGSQAVHLGSLG